jgi:hypothetical protein
MPGRTAVAEAAGVAAARAVESVEGAGVHETSRNSAGTRAFIGLSW